MIRCMLLIQYIVMFFYSNCIEYYSDVLLNIFCNFIHLTYLQLSRLEKSGLILMFFFIFASIQVFK